MTEKLPLIFSHQFTGRIWQVLPAGGQQLALEIRNEEKGEVLFYLYTHGRLTQMNVPQLPFWSSMLHAGDEYLVIREYGEEGRAEQMNLTGVEHSSGTIRWRKQRVRLVKLSGNAACIIDGDKQEWISLHSGELLKNSPAAEENILLEPPFQYTAGNPYFNTVKEFIRAKDSAEAILAADYIETGDKIVIGYYLRDDTGLKNRLLVATQQGDIVLTRTLADKLSGITDMSFLIFDGNLIFVKGLTQFFHYALTE